ncbi:family 16 glycoside hydrolase [Parafrankia sp. FMc6]|uniref:family 16 glycoside hydrolase n=1 Tax=Parafrankia soli TaxID=2599596 RepID=UPI0034D3C560
MSANHDHTDLHHSRHLGQERGRPGAGPPARSAVGSPRPPRRRVRRRYRLVVLALVSAGGMAALAGLWAVISLSTEDGPTRWRDGTRHGPWLAVFDGYGRTTGQLEAGGLVITLAPRTADAPERTHAGLVVSSEHYGDVRFTTQVRTVRQLRHGTPAPWEVGWVLWNYTDPAHFYAFALKPNGWELSKQDPAYPGGQRFLASGPAPRARLGSWHTVEVIHDRDSMAVSVDGVPTVRMQDTERPYVSGAVGLYCEDSVVEFRGSGARHLHPTDQPPF